MALLADADAEAQGQNAPVPFYDVSESWALPFIAYCAQNEIVAGSSGRFRPADHVTLRELAKMLLVLLGEDSARYVGAGWAQNVDQDAFEKGIYAGLTAGYEEDATRDNACLLIYNATLCPKVANASENSVQRYVLDALMNPMSYLEIRFGLTRYTATLTGNECADLTGSSPLPAGTSKLAGHKAFQVSTDLSLLGRSVDIYVKDGKVFGVPCYAVDEIYYTFADASQLKEICQGGGFRLTDETEYYYNYARSSKEILNAVTANDKITVIDHDGDNAFDVVLVTTSRPATVTATSPLTVDVGGQSYEDLHGEGLRDLARAAAGQRAVGFHIGNGGLRRQPGRHVRRGRRGLLQPGLRQRLHPPVERVIRITDTPAWRIRFLCFGQTRLQIGRNCGKFRKKTREFPRLRDAPGFPELR